MLTRRTSGRWIAAFAAMLWAGTAIGITRSALAAAETPARAQQTGASALERPVTVQLEQVTLVEALREVARQASIGVSYDAAVPASPARVTIRAVGQPAIAVIRDAAAQAGFEAVAGSDGESVRIQPLASADGDAARNGSILGLVRDAATGAAIPGAEVLLEGTSFRTVTGEDGRYRLAAVPPGSYSVLARRIGYLQEARPVTVAGQEEALVDVALEPAATTLGELVVTAQKQGAERLRDVPIPVAVLDAQTLADNGQTLLRDYYGSLPGFNVGPSVFGVQDLSVRGLAAAGGNPTTAVIIDDVPIGGSTARVGGIRVPDIDPGDLAAVEVLRGPQGTIYGANSLGGLLKLVTKDPALDRLGGHLEAELAGVHHGARAGYTLRGSVDIPLSGALAVRMSGYTRQDPGYIDNPVLDRKGINETRVHGARLSALWRPWATLSLKVSALYQTTSADAFSHVYVRPGLGDWQQNEIPGVGWYDHTDRAISAALNATFGRATLTAVTGYNNYRDDSDIDWTDPLGPANTQAQFGVSRTSLYSHFTNDKFTQEIRLSLPLGQRTEWLVGAFYTHERGPFYESMFARDAATGQVAGEWWHGIYPVEFDEYAAFASLTYHVTDRLDIQLGGRQSHSKEIQSATTQAGPFTSVFLNQPSPFITPSVSSESDAFTYLVTPRFRVSPNLMLYARLASGYRPGGANTAFGVPAQYDPDKTQNYEVGVKADFFDRKLFVDASLYYIDWQDIQINLVTSQGFVYGANGSAARSAGVELSASAQPLSGLTLSAWAAYNDAVLTQAFPAGGTAHGVSGDRLPNGSRFSAHFSAEQEFPLGAQALAFVGGAVSYVGDRIGVFTGSEERERYPAYTKTDLRAGVRYDAWRVNLFVNNVADSRGLLSGGLGSIVPYAYVYIRPRSVGLSLSRSF